MPSAYGARWIAATARAIAASPTSQWVTSRTVSGPSVTAHTPSAASVQQARRIGVAEQHDVRLHLLGDAARVGPALRHRLRQGAGPGVVVGQAIDHRVQGHQAGGRHDPHLPHATAQPLALHAPDR